MADILEFRPRPKPGDNDGFGEHLFTVHHYAEGHVVHWPSDEPPDFPAVWKKMWMSLWHESGRTFDETGDQHDEIIVMIAMATDGRVLSTMDNTKVETLEQIFWLQRRLEEIGREHVPPFKALYTNDNQPQEDRAVKNKDLQTYTRLKPVVLAVKIEPGVEDNWVATDDQGRELSRASTIDSVQNAAPNAQDYSPLLDLPGLEGQPLKMGDYVINDGDGVFYVMPAKDFEKLFAPGGDLEDENGEQSLKAQRKDAEKLAYHGKQLTIDELMQELKLRDDELKEANDAKAELDKQAQERQNPKGTDGTGEGVAEVSQGAAGSIAPTGGITGTPGGAHTGHSPIDDEPNFVEEVSVEDLDQDQRNSLAEDLKTKAQDSGSTFYRFTMNEEQTRMLAEGWKATPNDQGDPRWAQARGNDLSPDMAENLAEQNGQDPDAQKSQAQIDDAKNDPLDHDANGRKGGAKKPSAKKQTKQVGEKDSDPA